MRIILLIWLWGWCCLLYGQKEMERIPLDGPWWFTPVGEVQWREAVVPGTVHQDLIRHGLLPDPFYGSNEEKIQWVEDKDWEYKTTFEVSAKQIDHDAAFLHFEGLDTYADVYLNGALILEAKNMFIDYKIPVKSVLREGENRLHVLFHSPVQQTLPQWRSNGFNYPADNDHRAERVSVFTRKAPYSYGWDWGIRMATSGVWRPVTLCFQDVVSVEDFYVRQLKVSKEAAELSVETELQKLVPPSEEVVVKIEWALPGERKQTLERKVVLDSSRTNVIFPLHISRPSLWMPNGWGKPVLYDFSVSVLYGGKEVACRKQRVGLRSLRVVKEKDAEGECFYFEVNGCPLFAKGANYIPSDALLPAVTSARYRQLFHDVREANMNMLRVWGGGVYEDDRFYDLADENGILIWQDFMFACTTYPSDPFFLEQVAREAEYNIRRLRRHACLAIWCGNNEIEEGIKYWGWSKKYSPEVYQEMKVGYERLFRELLPRKVKELDPERFYMHGSPYFANWGRPESWKIADSHNWGVWYGRKPFESLDSEIPRFMSEFGFQSFPEMKTIATFASPEDYRIESEVMKAHQKSSIGNELIETYMARDYKVPERFEDFVYVGLVMQGRGIRRGLEAHRRNRPYCMGTLYWQLNDSWPVVSWSGIDYYGNWKALHYQAKRAFAPLLVSVVRERDSLGIWLVSDLLEKQEGLLLEMKLTDFKGKILKKQRLHTEAEANSSRKIFEADLQALLTPARADNCYLLLTLKDKSGRVVFEEPWFFESPVNLKLPEVHLHSQQRVWDGGCELTLKSDGLAKDVFIEVPIQGARLSDNFFDLLPGGTRKIRISSPEIKKGQAVGISVKHLGGMD